MLDIVSVAHKEADMLIVAVVRHVPSPLAVFTFSRFSSIHLPDTDTNQLIGNLVGWIDIIYRGLRNTRFMKKLNILTSKIEHWSITLHGRMRTMTMDQDYLNILYSTNLYSYNILNLYP